MSFKVGDIIVLVDNWGMCFKDMNELGTKATITKEPYAYGRAVKEFIGIKWLKTNKDTELPMRHFKLHSPKPIQYLDRFLLLDIE